MPYRLQSLAKSVSSRHYLKIIERVSALGTWAMDLTTGEMVWSASLHRLMCTDPATYRPTIDDIVARTHPDDRWIITEKFRSHTALEAVPARMIFPGGVVRWHLCHKEMIEGGDGTPTVMVGVLQDVTESWTAQRVLLQRQRILDGLVRLVGGMLWRAESDGSLVFDSGWCDFTGTTLAQNQGDGWLEALHPADRQMARDTWQRAVVTRGLYSILYRVRRFDGVYRQVHVKASPLLDDGGAILEWVGYGVEVNSPDHAAKPPEVDLACGRPTSAELKAARALVGFSVSDLALSSGVSTATITRHEAGDSKITIREVNLFRIREAFSRRGLQFGINPDGNLTLISVSPVSTKSSYAGSEPQPLVFTPVPADSSGTATATTMRGAPVIA